MGVYVAAALARFEVVVIGLMRTFILLVWRQTCRLVLLQGYQICRQLCLLLTHVRNNSLAAKGLPTSQNPSNNYSAAASSLSTMDVTLEDFYGKGYDDSDRRIPDMTIITK